MKSLLIVLAITAVVAGGVALAAGRRPRAAGPLRGVPGQNTAWGWSMPAPAAAPTGGGVPVVGPPATVVTPGPPGPGTPAVLPGNVAAAQPGPTAVAPSNVAAAQPAQPGSPTDMFAAWGPPPAPALDNRRFSEAHWQGLELIPKTPAVARGLGLPPSLRGVIVDDVSLPADLQGFRAGDVVTYVGDFPTANLTAFVKATDQLRDLPSAAVTIFRTGRTKRLELTGLMGRLGTANGETPTMILSGARSPHAYRGPCTSCHRIGTTGSLAVDQGDPTKKMAPAIRAGSVRPHRDRGTCSSCHRILP